MKYVPYEKMSKADKRQVDAGRRSRWAIHPATRTPAHSGVYRREREKQNLRRADRWD